MDNQITVFDLLRRQELRELSEEEMVQQVSEQIGVKFKWVPYPPSKYNEGKGEWIGKFKGLKLTLGYNTNWYGERVIFADYDDPKNKSGGGAPCDDVLDAICWFRKIINRYLLKGGKK